jgi:hypothetical protein
MNEAAGAALDFPSGSGECPTVERAQTFAVLFGLLLGH